MIDPTIDFTNPKIASLIVRYREWVADENGKIELRYTAAKNLSDKRLQEYRDEMARYESLPWFRKLFTAGPVSWLNSPIAMTLSSSYKGFIEWLIREGITIPKK